MSGLGKLVRGLIGVVVVVALIMTVNYYYGQYKSAARKASLESRTASATAGSSADTAAVVPVQGQSVTVLTAGVVLRAKPEATAKTVRVLKKGDTLVLVGVTASNWLQLRDAKGQMGFTTNDPRALAVKK